MKTKTAILLSLFIVSIATLIAAIATHLMVYAVATVVAHVALVSFGFFYARNSSEKMLDQIKHDLLT